MVVGIYHLINNWVLLKNYLAGKIAGGLRMKKELAISTLIILVIIAVPMNRIWPVTN